MDDLGRGTQNKKMKEKTISVLGSEKVCHTLSKIKVNVTRWGCERKGGKTAVLARFFCEKKGKDSGEREQAP